MVVGWVPAVYAQAPVIDVSAIKQLFQNYQQELKSYATQLQELEQVAQQVQWAASTFNSFVQSPNLATAMVLMNQVGIGDPLPVSPYTIQSLINGQGGISGTL